MQGKGVKGATANFVRFHCPLVASAEAKSPACGRKQACLTAPLCLRHQQLGRAHLARQYASGRMCGLGARLRTRKVTGRDASLPAPLLVIPLEWSPVERLGRCPKPHKGAPPLDPARGNFPLDPSARLSWSLLLTSSACCSFGLRLRPFSALIITLSASSSAHPSPQPPSHPSPAASSHPKTA